MAAYVALLRGINVGGKGLLPMKALAAHFEQAGCGAVKTYLQSGNVVFRQAPEKVVGLATVIAAAIAKAQGFQPWITILNSEELRRATEANPFPEAAAEPKSLHLIVLAEPPPAPDLEALTALKAERERFALQGAFFYLHAPDGIGRSKLAAAVEKKLGVPATARNWNSVTKLLELAAAD